MIQRNNILQELNELNSTLGNISAENIYTVPAGYFDGLAASLLNRIKAMNAANAVEELNYLSPSLNSISKQNIYSVPAGYFESLAENAMRSIREGNDYQTAKEEIESLSPLLSGLKKEMSDGGPYSVPQGYFESITSKPVKETKVVSITHRKWFRYASAAVVIGIIALVGINKLGKEKLDAGDPIAGVQRDIKKISDDDLKNFIQYTDAGLNGEEKVSSSNTNEVKEFLKDIPESELKEFIEETADTDDAEASLMN